jgi:subtilase family serine protease
MKRIAYIFIVLSLFALSLSFSATNADAAAKKPDLISNIYFSQSRAYQGESVLVYVKTQNIGYDTAAYSTTKLTYINLSQYFLVLNLSVSSSHTDTLNYTCGTQNVTFTSTADYYNTVDELWETNNQANAVLECIAR